MEATNVSCCKYILTTFEQGQNHYYDSLFHLKPPFRPNSNGQYKITINEVCFKNNEATLLADEDYIIFKIYIKGQANPLTVKYNLKQDIFTYTETDAGLIVDVMEAKDEYVNKVDNNNCIKDTVVTTVIGAAIGRRLPQRIRYHVVLPNEDKFNEVYQLTMEYTSNFAYVLNNMNLTLYGKHELYKDEDGNENNSFYLDFWNMKISGPTIYYIETPLSATVPTYNANNEGYNIVALSYNQSSTHNSMIQMNSSMECTTNGLQNIRFRLLNDQAEVVRIHEPMYIQFTVSNEG